MLFYQDNLYMNTFKIWRGTQKKKKICMNLICQSFILYEKNVYYLQIKDKEKYNTDKILFFIFKELSQL